jgi:hypothetical protein
VLNWKETHGVLDEFLNCIYKKKEILEEDFDNMKHRIDTIFKIISQINDVPIIDEIETKFGFERFLLLDPAQKTFVILAVSNKKLKNFDNNGIENPNFKLIVNTIYLKLLKSFSTIRKRILNKEKGVETYKHINDYIQTHPKLKKLGCGQFSLNFHKHVKNLMAYLYKDEKFEV